MKYCKMVKMVILDLEKGKKPNTENLKNIILETINKKELTEDKKKTQKNVTPFKSLMRIKIFQNI